MRVLNAGHERGRAAQTAWQLQVLGFAATALPGNAPEYPNGTMRCVGEIRFGADGLAAARALSLVVPCTQLVRDDTLSGDVELVLGNDFTGVHPTNAAQTVLTQLRRWTRTHPAPEGGLLGHAAADPTLRPALLRHAHTTAC